MEVTNEYVLRLYEQRVRNLDESDETGTDEELAIVTRDLVAERRWTAKELSRIDLLDAEMLAHAQQFEDVFPYAKEHDRTHWWWFLHEGPQVREEARRLTEASEAAPEVA